MNNDDLSQLNYGQLARLWSIGLNEKDFTMTNQSMQDTVRKAICETTPLRGDQQNILPTILNRLHKKLERLSDKSLMELLQDPNTDLIVLQSIKDAYKHLARGEGVARDDPLSLVIYYAAIASALVHKDSRITSHSYEKLAEDFTRMTEWQWLPPELKSLYDTAIAKCIQRKE